MFAEDDLLPISALQHLAFCPRQCALIHVERLWDENRFTAEGHLLHQRVHEEGRELRTDVLSAKALSLRSLRLGLIGQADVVEFHRYHEGDPQGIELLGRPGLWCPFPIEYKRGRPKSNDIDEVQLCCQAMCLEEMLTATISAGALFYGKDRRRSDVAFTDQLRTRTKDLARELHRLVSSEVLPKATYDRKCRSCSLIDQCLPRVSTGRKKVNLYLSKVFAPPAERGDDS